MSFYPNTSIWIELVVLYKKCGDCPQNPARLSLATCPFFPVDLQK